MDIVNFISIILTGFGGNRLNFVKHPDAGLSVEQLTFRYGYPLETHQMQTPDGYILKTHRIPHGRYSNSTNPYPILLGHGTCGSSHNFIAIGEHSLGYFLAENGFDVWMMNARGNEHSREHVYLNPNTDKMFWDFSWHEIGVIDIPTNIDYILSVTQKSKLTYLGHSEGTTRYFPFLSEKPEYNKKLSAGILMAPSAMYKYTNQINTIQSKNGDLIRNLMDFFGIYELFPNETNYIFIDLLRRMCSEQNILIDLCRMILQFGNDSGQMDPDAPQLLFSGAPSRCAFKQLAHYYQVIHTGYFAPFNYGPEKNYEKYGSAVPQKYNFSNVLVPTIFVYGEYDTFCTVRDVEKLMTFVKYAEPVKIMLFNHIDFIAGKAAKELAFEPMINLLRKHL